jgi:hypothetical protein
MYSIDEYEKQLLDPLGTLCSLQLLISANYKQISIHDHVLTLHKPDNYQSMIRLIKRR